MKYTFPILMSLLLTVTTVAAHPNVKFTIPGVTTLHQQKFFLVHPTGGRQLNRFQLSHNSMIVGGSSLIPRGNGNPYAMAINSSGIVSASSVVRRDRKILLTSGSNEKAFDSRNYDQAFAAAFNVKHQTQHDNQYVAQFDAQFVSAYYNKKQLVHQQNLLTAKRNLRIYESQIQYVTTPYGVEAFYPPYTTYYSPYSAYYPPYIEYGTESTR